MRCSIFKVIRCPLSCNSQNRVCHSFIKTSLVWVWVYFTSSSDFFSLKERMHEWSWMTFDGFFSNWKWLADLQFPMKYAFSMKINMYLCLCIYFREATKCGLINWQISTLEFFSLITSFDFKGRKISEAMCMLWIAIIVITKGQ